MKVKSPSRLFNSEARLMAPYGVARQIKAADTATTQESSIWTDFWGGNGPLRSGGIQRAIKSLQLLAFMTLAFCANSVMAYAQISPPSRPILFVHGWCGSAYDWAPLFKSTSILPQELPDTMYPDKTVYLVEYNSISNEIAFWKEDNPSAGASTTLTSIPENMMPSNARFFAINFYDPNPQSTNSTDPANVTRVSILNKAYEVSQVIKHILLITNTWQVNIVAHSMGGLDARAYVENLASSGVCYIYSDSQGNSDPFYGLNTCSPGQGFAGYDGDVANIITIDTPHAGSPLATPNALLGTVGTFVDPSLKCQADASTNMTELLPLSLGGEGLIEFMNYSPSSFSLNPPIKNQVPIQAIEDYFTDTTLVWHVLSGPSDDIVTRDSQSITSDSQTPTANLPGVDSSASLVNLPVTYTQDDAVVSIATNPGCWAQVIGPELEVQILHPMSCLGELSHTQLVLTNQLINDTVPWVSSWNVTPITPSLGESVTISYSASDLSTSTLSRAELWRAPDANGVPGTWAEVDSPQTLSGNGPTPITFTDTPTAAGKYWYGTHLFDSAGNEATEPSPAQVTIGVASQAPTVTVQASPTQVTQGSNVTLSVTVQSSIATPTGTVTFYDGSSALSSAIALNNVGAASYSASVLSLGSHSITARYSGSSSFSSSTSAPITVNVTGVSPAIAVTPSTGTIGVTSFTKSGTGFTPYGPITHTATWPDNTKSVLNGFANSTGGFSYPVIYSSETGTYYQTDTDNTTGQSSNTISWTVSPVVTNDFSLTVSPNSQSVLQSGSAIYNIVTTTTSGTAQTVSFGASNLPSGLNATFSPTSLTTGSQSTLTITASASAPVGTYTLVVAGASSYTTHTYQISVTVAQTQTGPVMTVTPSIVRFNDQSVGTISSPQTVVLRNSGTGQLIITGIGLASGNTDYALNLSGFSSPLILNQGVTYSLPVYFEPASAGTRSGQIVIYDNAPGSPQVVSLTGNGLAAQPSTGTINVIANLNGVTLPALYYYQYSLAGPTAVTGYDNNSFSVTAGTYSITFGNNPSYFTLASVTPSSSQSVAAGDTTTFTLNFTAPNDFYGPTFMQPPGGGFTPQIIPAGSTATYYVDVSMPTGNASSPITLSVLGAPTSSTPAFNPQPMYSGFGGTLTIGTTAGATQPGVYALTVSGTNSNGVTHVGNTSSLAVTALPTTPTQLVSQSSSGVQANSGGFVTSSPISGDGRFVAFSSSSTNLVSGTASGHQEIYVRDIQSATTSLASVSTSGVPADSDSYGGSMSANGQYVVFYSFADNLYPGSVLNAASGVYVRELAQGVTEREDVAADGTPANGSSYFGAISGDGRYVAFISTATNLVSGVSGTQLYLRDRKTSHTILISVSGDGSPANGNISSESISADGRYIAFVSSATNLVSQNTNGVAQAFVRDVASGTTDLVSVSSNGVPANTYVLDDSGSAPPAISSDGRYIAFSSYATNLVSQPTDGTTLHNFVYDRQSQQIALADVDSVGTPLSGTGFLHPAVSLDGRFVAFYGFGQVLVRDTVESQTAVVSLASNGQAGNNSTWGWNIGLGGSRVSFASTATNLVANDSNSSMDSFVASNPFVGNVSLNSLSLGSSSASGGSTVTGTVTLTGAAPAGGAVVSVWSNNDAAQPPAVVTVPAGATSASFSFSTSLVPSESVMTILAAFNGGSSVAVLTLEPAPELAVSPSTWDFGYQAVGTTSAIESFVLSNSGTAPLTINSVQLATGQVFKISANSCGSSIAAGGSCSVSVVFGPSAPGSASDAVQINYGSPATVFSISLTGNGATPVAALTPAPLNFGNQSMPGSSTEVATLTNSGNAPLSNISASISGTNTGDFSISSDGCSGVVLPANSNCLVTVSFSPKAKGNRAATLSIADSASGSPQAISLTGTGAQSTPTLLWSPSAASITYGTPLGTGVLDATANQSGSNLAGTFAYTATSTGGTPQVVTQATLLGVGTYTLTATFTPNDATDYTTATATVSITITPATPAVTVSPSASSITTAQALTVTVSVSGGTGKLTPTGSVTLSGGGYTSATATLTSGSATINIPAGSLATGSDTLTASYAPDSGSSSTYNSATGSAPVAVTNPAKTTPAVTVSPSSSNITTAQALTVTVAVSGGSGNPTPTGSVTLTGGGYTSAAITLSSGSATINIPANSLSLGTDSLAVSYTPDSSSSSTYNSASGSVTVTVTTPAKTTPTVTVTPSASSITTAHPLTVTVAVSGGTGNPTPTGTVTLTGGGYTSVATTLSSGSATINIPANSLSAGTDSLAVSYTPDPSSSSTYNSASGSVTVTVTTQAKTTPTVTATPSSSSITTAQALTVTVAVNGGTGNPTPTGTVTVTGGGFTSAATTLSGGAATISIPAGSLTTGTDTLAVSYSPDSSSSSTYNSASGSVTVTVTTQAKTTPTVTATPSSSSITTAQALTVTVAVNGGSGNPTPTGSVTLTDGGYTSAATTLSSGSASINIPAGSLATGSDTLTVSYTPDSNSSSAYNSATGSATVAVTNPAKITPTVTVTPSASSITTAQALTVTVAVSGGAGNPTPTGTLTLSGGGYTSPTTTLTSGATSINIPAGSLVTGSDTLTVSYTPDSNSSSTYNSATGSNSVTVTTPAKTTPTVTVTPSASSITTSQALTVTVVVSGGTGNPTPTGSVTLSSGTYSAQQTIASGAASFTIAAGTLGNGANTLTASYSGDATYAVASSTTTVTVEPVSISTTTPSPVNPGSSTTSTVTLTGSGGYSGTMNLSCSLTTSPTGAQSLPTCALNPTSLTLASGGSGTSTLTVNTTAASTTALARPTDQHLWKLGGGGAVLAALLLFGIPFRRRRWISMLALLLLVAAAGAIGCGGGGGTSGGGGGLSTPATTAGNYTFTVAATDSVNSKITTSTTVTITVQ